MICGCLYVTGTTIIGGVDAYQLSHPDHTYDTRMANQEDDLFLTCENWADEKDVKYTAANVDEFVNEENIIWDWNDVPKIVLTVETKTENGKVYLDCSFQEKNVNLDSWTPRCFKITDTEIELTDIEKNASGDNQFTVRDSKVEVF
jgi:hypothetical protein